MSDYSPLHSMNGRVARTSHIRPELHGVNFLWSTRVLFHRFTDGVDMTNRFSQPQFKTTISCFWQHQHIDVTLPGAQSQRLLPTPQSMFCGEALADGGISGLRPAA